MKLEEIKAVIPHPHKEGYPFIIGAFVIALLLYAFDLEFLGTVMLIVGVWVVYFFRDPIRMVPQGEGLIISPADGMVQMIVEAAPPAVLEMGDEPLTRVSIFLNIFNVHINRSPVEGTVTKLYYHPGKFLNASLDKASEENERQLVKVTAPNGKDVGFVQIAGLVARRILCTLHEGQPIAAGERFGLIRFGSRMDVYLPKGVNPQVVVGQVAIAGETIIGDMKTGNATRTGVAI